MTCRACAQTLFNGQATVTKCRSICLYNFKNLRDASLSQISGCNRIDHMFDQADSLVLFSAPIYFHLIEYWTLVHISILSERNH